MPGASGRSETNAISALVRQAGMYSFDGAEVTCVKAPVAMSIVQMSYPDREIRSDENAIRLPSGDQTGSRASPASSVTARSSLPSAFIVQLCHVLERYA